MTSIRSYGRQGAVLLLCLYVALRSGLVMGVPSKDGNSGSGSSPSQDVGVRGLLLNASVFAVLDSMQVCGNHIDEILHGPVMNEGNLVKAITAFFPYWHELPRYFERFHSDFAKGLEQIRNARNVYKRYNDVCHTLKKLDPMSPQAIELVGEQRRLELEFEQYKMLAESALRFKVDIFAPVVLRLFQDVERMLQSP
ncbi:aldo keto reductase, putative [Babesia ovata]|uniref:Aldo keto reductase, putative n=1 Tax=Babesia ovata TaxID=189622 RepID=A0A2H6K6Z8_9APIC|nr:aldo keto reductase, putative [Babesia ovata]GBE58761.1 aldo keto reductase, putative [Babesia ovata]